MPTPNLIDVYTEARQAGENAGAKWMENAKPQYAVHSTDLNGGNRQFQGTILDVCGNAHVTVKDKRSKLYKDLLKLQLVRGSNGVIEMNSQFRGRQEHGLKMAIAEAVKAVFEQNGYTGLQIWDYID